jgi:hypothetical protein
MSDTELTQDRLRSTLCYCRETGVFTWLVARSGKGGNRLGKPAGYKSGNRIKICINQSEYMAHRLAWFYVHGVWPQWSLDHIDGDGTNNRLANLRDVEHHHNMQNIRKAHKDSHSGLLGVSWHAGRAKWHARISVRGRGTHIGYYADPECAHEAYVKAKRKLHEFQTL